MGLRNFMQTFMGKDGRDTFDYRDTPESDKEMETASWVRHLYEQAKQYRRPWEAPWKTVFEFVMGEQWGDIPKWKADIVENYMFSTLVGMVALMTENRPRIEIRPDEPGVSEEYADAMNALFWKIWENSEMPRVIEESTTNALQYSAGIYHPVWDPGKKDICTYAVDPQCIYLDKDARSISTSEYVLHVTRMPYHKVLEYWPKARGKFAPGTITVEEEEDYRDQPYSGEWMPFTSIRGPSGRMVPAVRSALGDEGMSDDGLVQILQLWIKDPSFKDIDLLDAAGKAFKRPDGSRIRVRVPTYPGGRHIILAGNRIVHDGPNPYWHGEFPYVDQKCYLVPNEFWGISAMQNLVSPQKQVNKTQSFIIDVMNATAAPPWVADKNCGIDPAAVDPNKPGQFLFKTPGSEVRREQPPSLPQYLDRLYQNERAAIDSISGLPEATFGEKPAGVQSGVALQSLAAHGQRKMGLPTRHLEAAIRHVGRQWIGLAQQYVTEAQMIRVRDEDTDEERFVQVTPEMVQRKWGIHVVAGSTLPEDKAFLHQQAIELGSLQWIDREAALQYINFPGAKKIARRMKQQEELQMRMQAAMASRKQPGQQGGGGGRQRMTQGVE